MKYGPNEFNIPMPKFWEIFQEHATAPFFLFQIFCVGLWCLDEYWMYSLFTLFMLVVFEMMMVKRRMGNMKMIRNMRTKPFLIYVCNILCMIHIRNFIIFLIDLSWKSMGENVNNRDSSR